VSRQPGASPPACDIYSCRSRGSVDKNVEGRVHTAVKAPLAIGVNSLYPYLVCICLFSYVERHERANGSGAGINRLNGCPRSKLYKAIADLKTKVEKVGALGMVQKTDAARWSSYGCSGGL